MSMAHVVIFKPEHLCTHAHAPFMRNICQRESLSRDGMMRMKPPVGRASKVSIFAGLYLMSNSSETKSNGSTWLVTPSSMASEPSRLGGRCCTCEAGIAHVM